MITRHDAQKDSGMTASIQICLAETDATVLAALSAGVIAALVWVSFQEYQKARRTRRRLESKRRQLVE
jgi:hypothetical protein